MQVSFGEFIADFDRRRLAHNREIRLTSKGFELRDRQQSGPRFIRTVYA
jgi:hypothetical protein